ncbi:hypothetical protein OG21DRAFT_1512407 [Imleria badia]|nr:hypothetical protein OG21DRAFT_1512407 [Imleria badia]
MPTSDGSVPCIMARDDLKKQGRQMGDRRTPCGTGEPARAWHSEVTTYLWSIPDLLNFIIP